MLRLQEVSEPPGQPPLSPEIKDNNTLEDFKRDSLLTESRLSWYLQTETHILQSVVEIVRWYSVNSLWTYANMQDYFISQLMSYSCWLIWSYVNQAGCPLTFFDVFEFLDRYHTDTFICTWLSLFCIVGMFCEWFKPMHTERFSLVPPVQMSSFQWLNLQLFIFWPQHKQAVNTPLIHYDILSWCGKRVRHIANLSYPAETERLELSFGLVLVFTNSWGFFVFAPFMFTI